MRCFITSKRTFSLMLVAFLINAAKSQSSLFISSDHSYSPGAILQVNKDKGQVEREVIPYSMLKHNLCFGKDVQPESGATVKDVGRDFRKKEEEKAIKSIFRVAYGLPMDAELKAIKNTRLWVRDGEGSGFFTNYGIHDRLVDRLSCRGLETLTKGIKKEKNLFYLRKSIEIKKAELQFSWAEKPTSLLKDRVSDLLKIKTRATWSQDGRYVVSYSEAQPYLLELVEFDKKTFLAEAKQRMKDYSCACNTAEENLSVINSAADISGLVLYYPFNRSAEDVGGAKFHGALSNAGFVSDRHGKELGLHIEANGYFKIPKTYSAALNLLLNHSFSISFWMLEDPAEAASYASYPVFHKAAKDRNNTSYNGLWLYKETGKNQLCLSMSDKEINPGVATAQRTLNKTFYAANYLPGDRRPVWNHYLLTVDRENNRITLYQNGREAGEVNNSMPFPAALHFNNEEDFVIGANGGHIPPRDLTIDDLAIFNRSLSAEEAERLAGL